jgi:hypothetical protein
MMNTETKERWVYLGLEYNLHARYLKDSLSQVFMKLDDFPNGETHAFTYRKKSPLVPTGQYRPGSIWDVIVRYDEDKAISIIRNDRSTLDYVGLLEDEDQLVRLQASNDAALIDKDREERIRKENMHSSIDRILEPLAEEYSTLKTMTQRASFMARIYQSIVSR